jgi:hypothetical protein
VLATSLYASTTPRLVSYLIPFPFLVIQNDVACALSAAIVLYLIHRCNRRKAAVGRIELRATLSIYIATCILQLLTTGSIFPRVPMPSLSSQPSMQAPLPLSFGVSSPTRSLPHRCVPLAPSVESGDRTALTTLRRAARRGRNALVLACEYSPTSCPNSCRPS